MIESIEIGDAKTKAKRLRALIKYADGKTKTVNFGQRNSKGTYADGASDKKRDAYIARHSKAGEDWGDPTTAGYMSRHVLWEFRSSGEIESFLKRDTGAKKVSVSFNRYNVK